MEITLSGKTLYQSKYLYIQAAGSTGIDGSLEGIHLRWDLLGDLGLNHIPKGELEKTNTSGFNKDLDYVNIYRSKYKTKYPVILDFTTTKPSKVIESDLLGSRRWVFKADKLNTNDTIYVIFQDKAKYDSISINPKTDTIGFLQAYGDGLIEVSVKNKLCFASEIYVNNFGSNPSLKVESISNTVDDGKVVSCRKTFNMSEIGVPSPTPAFLAQENDKLILQENLFRIYLEQSSMINNLIGNGNFENNTIDFETEYLTPITNKISEIEIVTDAQNLDIDWKSKAVSGTKFLAVAGSDSIEMVVWKKSNISISPNKSYTFSGWLSNLSDSDPTEIPIIELILTGVQSGISKTVQFKAPDVKGKWLYMEEVWLSGNNTEVTVEIKNNSKSVTGNKFGLDNLVFAETLLKDYGRVVNENISKVRFKTLDCSLYKINIETYDNYISNINTLAGWDNLGNFGLSLTDSVVYNRLEKTAGSIHGKWPKYKGAQVNIENYKDRWIPSTANPYNGLKNGVTEYISLSHDGTNETATINTIADPSGSTGTAVGDGNIKSSYLDMLKVVSMDYHIARMLGLGYIDDEFDTNLNTEYIYVAQYSTFASLPEADINNTELTHLFTTIPIKKSIEKLPLSPTLHPIQYGLTVNKGSANEVQLSDINGYTFDGKSRYVNLYLTPNDDEPNDSEDFFIPATEFSLGDETDGVFVGIDYRKHGVSKWDKKVITPDEYYKDSLGNNFEVSPIPFPVSTDGFLFQHKEKEEGYHDYTAFCINWFSRTSDYSNIQTTNETKFTKPNTLLPPINVNVQLIQEENPRFLTTYDEQNLLKTLSNATDKTLVRLTFDYTHSHDLTYDYGNLIEIFYRTDAPASVAGQIKTVNVQGALSTIETEDFSYVDIKGNIITATPFVNQTDVARYIGGAFTIKNKTFEIVNILQPTVSGNGTTFILKNIEVNTITNTNPDPDDTPIYETVKSYINPSLYKKEAFTAIENMSNVANWKIGTGIATPLSCEIQIGDSNWKENEETIVSSVWDNNLQKNVPGNSATDDSYKQKVRGIWDTATIVQKSQAVPNPDPNTPNTPYYENIGVYEVTFDKKKFSEHPQHLSPNPVSWYKGVIRINTTGDPNGMKKPLEVLNIISTDQEYIKLLIHDPDYVKPTTSTPPQNNIPETTGVEVNYFPGYKVYLYADTTKGLTESNILPAKGSKTKVTYIGTRTLDSTNGYKSKISVPATILAFEIEAPQAPEKPLGGLYATRPDFYNKATYSFMMKFKHEPFAVAFYRASERMILESLYKPSTIEQINQFLSNLGDDAFFTSRWQSLVAFEYDTNGDFKTYPNDATGYKFPTPDKEKDAYGLDLFVDSSKKAKYWDAQIREAVYNAFLPLTEQPLLYKYISSDQKYVPRNKKQIIKGINGELLDPTDKDFDQAPMAKVTGGSDYEVLFTDFSLDGSANNFYFYCGIELSNRMQFSDFGSIMGPIQLVNSSTPEPPKVKKVNTQLSDDFNNISTAVLIDISNYNSIQKIAKISLYRATQATDAISTRTMDLVKELDLETNNMLDEDTLTIIDDFANDVFIPYGDLLYYKVVANRKIKYADNDGTIVTDYVPSQPSKTVLANIIDNETPIAPELSFSNDSTISTSELLIGCKLTWNKVTHNAKYYVYKMSSNGNWMLLSSFKNNSNLIEYKILDSISKIDEDGNEIFCRFKVDIESSSGKFNVTENAITI